MHAVLPHTAHRRSSPPAFGHPRGGSTLADRYSVRCSSRTLSCSVGLAISGTHRPFPVRDAWTKQRPFPHRGFCCPVGSSGTTAASDSLPARHPLPGSSPVYRARRSDDNLRRPSGRGGPPQFPPPPSERSEPHTPGGSSGLRFQALRPFRGLRPDDPGSAPPLSCPAGRRVDDAAGFASCCRPLSCSPKRAFDAGLRPGPLPDRAASLLPGLLAATRTGLTPAGDDELMFGSGHH